MEAKTRHEHHFLKIQDRGRISIPPAILKRYGLNEQLTLIIMPNGIFIPNIQIQNQMSYIQEQLLNAVQLNLNTNATFPVKADEGLWEKIEKDWQQTDQSFIEFDKKITQALIQLLQPQPKKEIQSH